MIAEGTPAAGTGFAVQEVLIALRCRRCGAEAEIKRPAWNCRACGAYEVEIFSGNDLLVEAVELKNGSVIQRRAADGSE
jgi:hydrogenase nickel incorporation protein HypA/HybF